VPSEYRERDDGDRVKIGKGITSQEGTCRSVTCL
jgi:hypothetical protein